MPMLKTLEVEDFGCVAKLSVVLTPLHAFIGPNDSGKTSLLRAMQWACSASLGEVEPPPDYTVPPHLREGSVVRLEFGDGRRLEVARGRPQPVTGEALQMPTLMRLAPDALRDPSPVILHNHPMRFRDERGAGLASIYDALASRNFTAFSQVRESVLALFPTIAEIGFPAFSPQTRTVQVKLKDGRTVPVHGLSEGLLYYLALAVLPHIDAGALVLVEEPENGLHPARIAEVVRVLREVSKQTQVILATHSPLVINELEPDEVTIVTRDPSSGTQAQPMAATPNFEERSSVYKLGELWLAYSDGEFEAPLLRGGPRP